MREDGQRESEEAHCLKQGSQSPGARKADLPCDSETLRLRWPFVTHGEAVFSDSRGVQILSLNWTKPASEHR